MVGIAHFISILIPSIKHVVCIKRNFPFILSFIILMKSKWMDITHCQIVPIFSLLSSSSPLFFLFSLSLSLSLSLMMHLSNSYSFFMEIHIALCYPLTTILGNCVQTENTCTNVICHHCHSALSYPVLSLNHITVLHMLFTTERKIVPGAPPRNVTGFAVDSRSIRIFWDPPPLETHNGLITNYIIKYWKVRDGTFDGQAVAFDTSSKPSLVDHVNPSVVENDVPVSKVQSSSSSSQDEDLLKVKEISVDASLRNYLIKNLEEWTSYKVTVSAATKVGQGPSSSTNLTIRTDESGMFAVPSFSFLSFFLFIPSPSFFSFLVRSCSEMYYLFSERFPTRILNPCLSFPSSFSLTLVSPFHLLFSHPLNSVS